MTLVPYRKWRPDDAFYHTPMKQGYDKDNQPYKRELAVKNGMNELMTIVAGLQKEVKRLNSCLTLDDVV